MIATTRGLIAVALLLAATQTSAASDALWTIRLRVVGLASHSKDYELAIFKDGRVRYLGGHGAKVRGIETANVPTEKVDELWGHFEKVGFRQMREEYLPETKLTPLADTTREPGPRPVVVPPSYQIGVTDLIWLLEVNYGSSGKSVLHTRLRSVEQDDVDGRHLQCLVARVEKLVDSKKWIGRSSIPLSAIKSCGLN